MNRSLKSFWLLFLMAFIGSEVMAQRQGRGNGNRRKPNVNRPKPNQPRANRPRPTNPRANKPRPNNPRADRQRPNNPRANKPVTPRKPRATQPKRNRNGNGNVANRPGNGRRNPGVTPRRPQRPNRPVVTRPAPRRPVYKAPVRYRGTPPIVARPIPRTRYGYRRTLPSYRQRYYGTYRFHRPYRYYWRPYTTYVHSPYSRIYRHNTYWTPYTYFDFVRARYRSYLYLNWIYWNSSRINGYHVIDGYPYYVFNGYRHRYSHIDTCNYQLIDKYSHRVVRSYWGQICSISYDQCAIERSRKNRWEGNYRYSCVETFRNRNYTFNHYNSSHSYRGGYLNTLSNSDYHYDDEYYEEYEYQGDDQYYNDDFYYEQGNGYN
jgi:hypothetical protein